MAPLQLEGKTLGIKQKNFNILIEKEVQAEPAKSAPINADGSDLENLLTIEIASKTKNLEVILYVLKSEDMLYVSRAIKHSTWLVTDPQYAYIINPEYLHTQLFPHMTMAACNKLLLHIRLNLKDEGRVDDFYHYFKKRDENAALKWLPHCSIDVINKAVENQHDDIEIDLLKRLCEKSITPLETYVQKCSRGKYYSKVAIKRMKFLINDHPEKYLDLVENDNYYRYQEEGPSFGPKATKVFMKICPQRILDHFEKYCINIDLHTFAKYLKSQDVKGFLLKYREKDKMKDWFKYNNLKHFIRYIPKEERFDFLNTMFIEQSRKSDGKYAGARHCQNDEELQSSMRICPNLATSANIYRLYKFAPFQTAFPDLKKLMRSESSPSVRNAMLAVLFSCANRNQEHINELLEYFHDKHINEPFKFKQQVVNLVITQTNLWTYDEKAWNNLNNIFHSMEVYTKSENNVQTCIHCIIVKKVLHCETIPDIIEKKFLEDLMETKNYRKTFFDTLNSVQKKLSLTEKNKIFNYLSNKLLVKIRNFVVHNEDDFTEVVQLLEKLLSLVLDYNKELADFPSVVAKIKELARIKAKESWKTDMLCLYNKRKSWRRHMFEESMLMCPSEAACLNALKHEPDLLLRHEGIVAALRCDDAVSLRRVLAKLRVYWHDSLAAQWASKYLAHLKDQGGHKAIVRGLCTLLPSKQLIAIIKKYEPNDKNINWSEDDKILLSLRKQIAKNMYIARPALSPDTVLPFARGDYLQFALPSLNAIFYNISPNKCRYYIPKLLEAPVSLQKHGFRLAFAKLESAEQHKIFSKVWKSTKNLSIRAALFKQTHFLLCNEKDQSRIEGIWKVLETFIENLSHEEKKITYILLSSKVRNVPIQVRAKFCMKAYAYLKSLSPKVNCESFAENVISCTRNIMESLEANFVINIIQESPEYKCTFEASFEYLFYVSAFLLCTEDAESQIARYERLLFPLLDRCFGLWETKVDSECVVKNNVRNLLKFLIGDIPNIVFEKKMVFPVQLFVSIQEKLEAKLPMQRNYVLVKTWTMAVNFVRILEDHKSLLPMEPTGKYSYQDERWDEIYLKAAPAFAAYILKLLKEEMTLRFPSVCRLLGKSFECMHLYMNLNDNIILEILRNILVNNDSVESFLLVNTALPSFLYRNDDQTCEKYKEIHRMFRSYPSDEVKMLYYSEYMDEDVLSSILI